MLLVLGALYWLLRPEPGRPEFPVATFDFGDQRFGTQSEPQTLTVTNGGELPLEIAALQLSGDAVADFAILEDGCSRSVWEPGTTCDLVLRFAPGVVGQRQANLEVLGRRTVLLPLAGRSVAPRVEWLPGQLVFEPHAVGEKAAGADLVVRNAGTAPLELEKVYVDGQHAGEFRLTGRCGESTLAIDESCDLRIAFRPGAAGARSAELVIESDAPEEIQRVPLTGEGVWDGPELVAQPESVRAGLQRVGARAKAREVRFVNRAAEAVVVESVAVSPSSSGFSVDGAACRDARLEPGEACAVAVGFEPGRPGDLTATLDLRLVGGGGATVALSGRGGTAEIDVQTATVDFGRARVDAESRDAELTLSSSGEVSLTVESLTVEGDGASSFSIDGGRCTGGPIGSGERCAVELRFRPVAAGEQRARLTIASDAARGSVEVTLAGTGLGAELAVASERVGFGTVPRGERSEQTVELRNPGSAALAIRSIKVAGTAASDFAIATDRCGGAAVAAGSRCQLTVRFSPSAEGRRLAFLLVDHDGLVGPSELTLAGEGGPPVPEIRVDRMSYDLGSIEVGDQSPIETIEIVNPGLGPLQLRDMVLAGRDAGSFRLVPGTCAGVARLAPRGDCTTGVRFTPLSAGRKAAELVIDHDAPGGSLRIRLVGTATAPPVPTAPVPVPAPSSSAGGG